MGKFLAVALTAFLAALLSLAALAAIPALGPPIGAPRATGPNGRVGTALHGHWLIQVTEPDGRPVSRTEFTNDLTVEGQETLSYLLDGTRYIDRWGVHLESSPRLCSSTGRCGPEEGRGLTVESTGGRITLAGNYDPSFTSALDTTGRVTHVASLLHTCTITELWLWAAHTVRSPVVCDQPAFTEDSEQWVFLDQQTVQFTTATLPAPVEVARGQRIAVRVTFSLAEVGR